MWHNEGRKVKRVERFEKHTGNLLKPKMERKIKGKQLKNGEFKSVTYGCKKKKVCII